MPNITLQSLVYPQVTDEDDDLTPDSPIYPGEITPQNNLQTLTEYSYDNTRKDREMDYAGKVIREFSLFVAQPQNSQEELAKLYEEWKTFIPIMATYYNANKDYPDVRVRSSMLAVIHSFYEQMEPSAKNITASSEMLETIYLSGMNFDNMADWCASLLISDRICPAFKDTAFKFLSDFMVLHTADGFQYEAEEASKSHSKQTAIVRYKLIATKMYYLEKKMPGICKTLYEKFGIVCFDRYPDDVLMLQAQKSLSIAVEADDLVITSIADHNGALSNTTNEADEFIQVLSPDSILKPPVYVEAAGLGNIVKIARNILAIRGNQPFKRVHIHAHGNPNEIYFSSRTDGILDIGTGVNGHEIVPLLFDLTNQDSTVIVTGCGTGKDYGINFVLSFLDCRILGPKTISDTKASVKKGPEKRPAVRSIKKITSEGQTIPYITYLNGVDESTLRV